MFVQHSVALGKLAPLVLFLLIVLGGMAGCSRKPTTTTPLVAIPGPHESLPAESPVEFLEKCLERYDERDIRGYRLILEKQERIGGRLRPPEVIEVSFRARPYSVLMRWQKGAGQAQSVLYVEGENGGKMLVHPSGLAGRLVKVVTRDPEGAEARTGGRYPITEFGIRQTLESTLRDWKAAQEKGTLRADYVGIRILEPGSRRCYTLQRSTQPPNEEGISEATIYLDEENWFQIGTVLRGPEGLIGEYHFRDIQLNPSFSPDPFTRAALTR